MARVMGLSGLMWWIDRWRKSTAYTDMTLEEQGAYRNLLDEACLRGGYIPNDERILARACGDVTAWKRVKEPVLAHFVLTSQGYRNETLLEVIRKTVVRIEKQKRYRDRKKNGNDGGNEPGNDAGNEHGNASRNDAGNEPGYLDPDPDRELSTKQESSRRGRVRAFTGRRLKVSAAQHQVVLDVLGKLAERLNLSECYAAWDAELATSGEVFDALDFIKRRAVEAATAAGPDVTPVAPSGDEAWFRECATLHGGTCGGSLRHRNQMLLDGAKLEGMRA